MTFEDGSQLTTIGGSAFWQTALTSITIPASVTSIGNNAFEGCISLTIVTFQDGSQLTTIGDNAFTDSGLISIILPSTVTSFGLRTFEDCFALTSVILEGNPATSCETGYIILSDGTLQFFDTFCTDTTASSTPGVTGPQGIQGAAGAKGDTGLDGIIPAYIALALVIYAVIRIEMYIAAQQRKLNPSNTSVQPEAIKGHILRTFVDGNLHYTRSSSSSW